METYFKVLVFLAGAVLLVTAIATPGDQPVMALTGGLLAGAPLGSWIAQVRR